MRRHIIIFALIVTFECALGILDGKCNDIVINGYNYEQEILTEGVDTPYQMTVDYDEYTNVIFFSFTGADGFNTTAYLDLNTNKIGTFDDVYEIFDYAFDDTQKDLTEGSGDFYEFDYELKSEIKTNITDKDIWLIFTRDGVYFTTFADEEAFAYGNDELNRVEGIGGNVTLISADTENNVYFYNSSGLFCLLYKTGDIYNMKLSILSELFALSSARKADSKINDCDAIINNNINHEEENTDKTIKEYVENP